MTKKHFAAIAAAALAAESRQHSHQPLAIGVLEDIAHRLADAFATFNSNFDRDRFLRACRGES